ncbi:MAG: hypothetical protein L0387_24445 [Acidobacteria bacterium]|nr:hypothetical protein [Acidobacteriota bacterium]MCI0720381.1 hypothetical protein [Acidobacteriota bacterium]
MTNPQNKPLFRHEWHPSNEELLLYLDGEIRPKTEPKIKAHLKACWSCRVKVEKVDQLISDFMKYRKAKYMLAPNLGPKALLRFQAALERLDSESGRPPLLAHLISWVREAMVLPRFSLRVALFVLASCLIVFVLIRLNSAPSVSAKELLKRTETTETQRIRRVSEPVVYQKLQVRRQPPKPAKEDIVTWEIWNDAGSNRFKQWVESSSGSRSIDLEGPAAPRTDHQKASADVPPILAELEQVFAANHMDWRAPLSPTSYAAWRRSIQSEIEEVIETKLPDGNRGLALKTAAEGPFALNAILNAALIVRVED